MEAWTAAAITADLPSEHGDQQRHAEGQAQQRMVEEHLVPAVLGQVLGVAVHLLGILGNPAVQHGVAELDQRVAEDHRRVRVALLVGVGVVLAVHRHPLSRSSARRHPDDEAAGEGDGWPQGDRLVGHGPVQVHRRDDEGDLGGDQSDQDGLEDRDHWHIGDTSAGDDPRDFTRRRDPAAMPPATLRATPIRATMCRFWRPFETRCPFHELHALRPAGPCRLHRPRAHL